jgi:hypothetical protein
MIAAPAIAAPAASKLSVAGAVRSSTPAKKSSKAAPGIIVGVVALAAVGAGIAVVASDNDDDADSK